MDARHHASELTQEEVSCSADQTSGLALSREIVEGFTRLDPVVFWAKFWAQVDSAGPVAPGMTTACWVWTGTKTGAGYGQIRIGHPKRKTLLVHRVAFVYLNGPLAAGDDLLHGRCNNPLCVRHARKGAQVENMRDMAEQKRACQGNKDNNKRIGRAKALEIRRRHAAGESGPKLAAEFGIHYTGVYHIASGRSYPEALR